MTFCSRGRSPSRLLLLVGLATAVIIAPVLAPATRAFAKDDVDTELAKRHFIAGMGFYNDGNYVGALREFEAARANRALPAFEYNIAKCEERLERFADAIAAYQRYLDEGPLPQDIADVNERIQALKVKLAAYQSIPKVVPKPAPTVPIVPPQQPSSSETPPAPHRLALALGGVSLALLVASGLSELVGASRYSAAQMSCGETKSCSNAVVSDITTPETVAAVFLAVGVVAAVAAIIARVVEPKAGSAKSEGLVPPPVSVGIGSGGMPLEVRF